MEMMAQVSGWMSLYEGIFSVNGLVEILLGVIGNILLITIAFRTHEEMTWVCVRQKFSACGKFDYHYYIRTGKLFGMRLVSEAYIHCKMIAECEDRHREIVIAEGTFNPWMNFGFIEGIFFEDKKIKKIWLDRVVEGIQYKTPNEINDKKYNLNLQDYTENEHHAVAN